MLNMTNGVCVMYRVRIRTKDGSKVVQDNIPDLEAAYAIVIAHGENTRRHFAIDEVIYKPFSVLTARDAKQRLNNGCKSE